MPILDDIMDHDLLGPVLRKGIKQGRKEGQQDLVRKLVCKRFGEIPDWADEQIAKMSVRRLESFSLKVLDAASLEEMFA